MKISIKNANHQISIQLLDLKIVKLCIVIDY